MVSGGRRRRECLPGGGSSRVDCLSPRNLYLELIFPLQHPRSKKLERDRVCHWLCFMRSSHFASSETASVETVELTIGRVWLSWSAGKSPQNTRARLPASRSRWSPPPALVAAADIPSNNEGRNRDPD